MNGIVIDIEKETLENNNFRKVLYTAKNSQIVVMSLEPGQDIGLETHQLDQFVKIESGNGKSVLNGKEHQIGKGYSVIVPAGVEHNIINNLDVPMKIYTVYSPPNHKDGTIHNTKADAEKDEEHFDGKTTV
jgi:mannose-6-phosphate isomerase-like protein (cupin superfamily)